MPPSKGEIGGTRRAGRNVQTRVMRCEEGRSSNISWDGSSNWLAVGKSRQGGGILNDLWPARILIEYKQSIMGLSPRSKIPCLE